MNKILGFLQNVTSSQKPWEGASRWSESDSGKAGCKDKSTENVQ
jgi:hypothetical protein